jgi:hypothetical protein
MRGASRPQIAVSVAPLRATQGGGGCADRAAGRGVVGRGRPRRTQVRLEPMGAFRPPGLGQDRRFSGWLVSRVRAVLVRVLSRLPVGPQIRVSRRCPTSPHPAAKGLSLGAPRPLLVCLSAAALAAGGCGGGAHAQRRAPAPSRETTPSAPARYSARARSAWLRTCETAANHVASADARCACTLTYLEARVSQATLEASEQAVVRGEASEPGWMIGAVAACLHP